jgi:ATP-dependent helicase/nuclease subunit B
MTPFVGRFFGRAVLTEADDLHLGSGIVGRPVWGPTALLANLELRAGLPGFQQTEHVRLQRWSRRLHEIESATPRFYSRSYATDPLGTSRTLLSWRDTLVEGGWDGEAIPEGGDRLGTLHELERAGDTPAGQPDRLRAIEAELQARRLRPFEALELAEPIDVWPGRWRKLFGLLEELGTPVRSLEPRFTPSSADTDLGRLQSSIAAGERAVGQIVGDGSLVLLQAETSWELAHAVAALLRRFNDPSTAIVRGGALRPLDFALTSQGFPSQGLACTSPWRPVLQLLPLSVELAFEPKDPYRVLELLTLPLGPFSGLVGNRLATALAASPGIGGRAWRFAKESIQKQLIDRALRASARSGEDEAVAVARARADAEDRLERVAAWLEQPGSDPHVGAPRHSMLEIADRVRTWLRNYFVVLKSSEPDVVNLDFERKVAVVAAALSQAQTFHEALSHDPREVLDATAARQLVESVASSGESLILEIERSGRIDPVDGPAALHRSRDTVVWWHCTSGTEWRPSARPWRVRELEALRNAGILLVDPARRLAIETAGWRRAILAARRRLVLAVPRWSEGQELEPHPIWDEIVARFNATSSDTARITLSVQDALDGNAASEPLGSVFSAVDSLPLPPARLAWRIDASLLQPAVRHSASSVEALIGCPLRWVLEYRAGLRSASVVAIPSEPLMNGTLGHRLVEELHGAGVLADPTRTATEVEGVLDRLIAEEAAVLLRAGKAFERAQLKRQLVRTVSALSELLASSEFVVEAVESVCSVQWGSRQLEGRLDLLLRDKSGADFVLDLKWGVGRYRKMLMAGTATQLAIYAAARRLMTGAPHLPGAAYFSLKRGEILATDVRLFRGKRAVNGPDLASTWSKLERTVDLVERVVASGDVPVTGVAQSLPLLQVLNVTEAEKPGHLELPHGAACEYCNHSAICGRAWEAFS